MFASDPITDVYAFKASKDLLNLVFVFDVLGDKVLIVSIHEIHKHFRCNFAGREDGTVFCNGMFDSSEHWCH